MTGSERHCAAIRTDPGVARQSVNVDAIVFWLVWNAAKSISRHELAESEHFGPG